MFELGKFCICLYLQVLVNLSGLCFSRTDGFITTYTALLSLDKFHTRQSKMVFPYQTMVRTSVLWMHYLSLACSQDGLTGQGKLNMLSIGTAFQTCAHTYFSAAQIRYNFCFFLKEYCTSYWLCMDVRNENLGSLRNPGALFSCELNCSISQKNLHCILSSVHPVAFVDFGFNFSYFFM